MKTLKYIYNILIWIGLFIWQLPQNIVGVCMLPFVGKLKLLHTKRHAWCIRGSKMSGSISLGNIIILGTDDERVCAHELGHVVDSHYMGPLYLIITGLPSIIWATSDLHVKLNRSYYDFSTERRANRHSHLYVVRYSQRMYKLVFEEGYSLSSIK